MDKLKTLITAAIILLMLAAMWVAREEVRKEQAQDERMEELMENLKRLDRLEAEMKELDQKIDEFLHRWNMEIFESTAYAPHDNQSGLCASGNPDITALGYTSGAGRYAVDFDVIPKHARMYVEGEGVGIAADTGGAIRGYRVDIYRSTHRGAMEYGRRQIRVIWEAGK